MCVRVCARNLSYPVRNTCAVLYCHLWSVIRYRIFLHCLINGTIFGEKDFLNIKLCFHFLYNFCLKYFPFQEEFSEISWMYIGLRVKYPLFLSECNEAWIRSTEFQKVHKRQISWKSVQWEPSRSMRTEKRTGTTMLILASCNFANAPKNKAETNALRNYEKYWTGRLSVQLHDLQNTIINLPVSKRHGISSPAVRLLASKIQICCVELIMIYRTLNCVCKAFGQTWNCIWRKRREDVTAGSCVFLCVF